MSAYGATASLKLRTSDGLDNAAGKRGPRILNSGPSAPVPALWFWAGCGPLEIEVRHFTLRGLQVLWHDTRFANAHGECQHLVSSDRLNGPRQWGLSLCPRLGANSRGSYLSVVPRGTVLSRPLHTWSFRGFSSCCLGSRL